MLYTFHTREDDLNLFASVSNTVLHPYNNVPVSQNNDPGDLQVAQGMLDHIHSLVGNPHLTTSPTLQELCNLHAVDMDDIPEGPLLLSVPWQSTHTLQVFASLQRLHVSHQPLQFESEL